MEEKRTKEPEGLSQVYRLKIIKDKLTNGHELIKTVDLHSNGHSVKKSGILLKSRSCREFGNMNEWRKFELLKPGIVKVM